MAGGAGFIEESLRGCGVATSGELTSVRAGVYKHRKRRIMNVGMENYI